MRDLFPLGSLLRDEGHDLGERPPALAGKCRKTKQRVHRNHYFQLRLQRAVRALDELGLGESVNSNEGRKHVQSSLRPPNLAAKSVFASVREACARELPFCSDHEAFNELLGTDSRYHVGVGSLASYSANKLSIPHDQQQACPLHTVLEAQPHKQLSHISHHMSLSPEEYEAVIVDEGIAGTYTDPVLKHNRKKYVEFVRMLFDRGLISFVDARKVKTKCGLFFVTKKNGNIRFIIDARRAN